MQEKNYQPLVITINYCEQDVLTDSTNKGDAFEADVFVTD